MSNQLEKQRKIVYLFGENIIFRILCLALYTYKREVWMKTKLSCTAQEVFKEAIFLR